MFAQILDPTGNLFTTWIVALIPVIALLTLLAGLRVSAWLATLIGQHFGLSTQARQSGSDAW
jgi:lactate permease